MKNLIALLLFISLVNIGNAQISYNKNWTEYTTFEGVKIEYKFANCTPDNGREQVLVLLRYTNTTSDKVELNWKIETWRNGVCTNCNSTNPEYNNTIALNPYQTVEADGTTKRIKNQYIFGNFSKLVPGMNEQKLTDFKFQNLTKKIIQ